MLDVKEPEVLFYENVNGKLHTGRRRVRRLVQNGLGCGIHGDDAGLPEMFGREFHRESTTSALDTESMCGGSITRTAGSRLSIRI